MVFSFVFKCAKERSLLYFCLRDGKDRKRISTKIIEDPIFFNKDKMCFEGGDAKFENNEIIDRWRYMATREIRAAQADGCNLSVFDLADRIRFAVEGNNNNFHDKTNVLSFYEAWATGKIKSKIPARSDRYHYHVFHEYVRGRAISFDSIDYKFMNDFRNWMVYNKGYRTNTIGTHIRDLKAVLNLAYKLGLHRNDAFRQFSKPSEEVDNVYLTEEEVRRIAEAHLPAPLAKARDLFLLGCYTAMRYSDCSELTVADVEGKFIHKRQEKTNGEVIIPIHPRVREIINRYGGAPKLALQNLNERIKEVCKIAGISEKVYKERRYYEKWQLVSSHTARRTGATLLYLQGVPTHSIMMITGHKSESSFKKYIKVTLQENAEILSKIKFFNE